MTETRQNPATAQTLYRAVAFVRDGRWHLEVTSLDSEPDTGDTEALLVTLRPVDGTPEENGFPADALREQLRENGFAPADPAGGDAGWTPDGDDRYTARCRPTDEPA
ncbi:hypothetical protein [Streptomyces lydicus]|uniref:hypothetical protein n=1 Tax=Streptomyces lydicus TaxID=47763 RepID=UPI000524ECB6|nr:hypothetical protein [Streptomyces lydicus]MDC7336290.1 hypothetical protein [Streptomyces lydicus]UEG94396.1 hypothetical protein LJ741_30005 [Streptomyces lydicus]